MHFIRLILIRSIVILFALSLVACGDSNSTQKGKHRSRGTTSNIGKSISTSKSGYGIGPAPWAKELSAAGVYTYENAITTDVNGNVYITGTIGHGLDGNILSGTRDFFLTKYDSMGAKVYTRQMGVPGVPTWGVAVAIDASGNAYVAGTTFGGLDGNTLTGMSDFFLTKYDSSGTKIYTKQIGVPGVDTWGLSAATDVGGNVYVAGTTFGGLDGNTLTGKSDFFLTKYDSSGTKLFTRQLGATGADTYGEAVETNEDGNIVVSGVTSGGLDGNAWIGSWNSFVTKYNNTGTKLNTKLSSAPVY
jgi:predicted secreted protein